MLAHFNKGSEKSSNGPRSVNDIAGSGAVRNFATKVFQIWREKHSWDDDDKNEEIDGSTYFLCQKNRYGDEKNIKLNYYNGFYF